jgi:hypothetical protein
MSVYPQLRSKVLLIQDVHKVLLPLQRNIAHELYEMETCVFLQSALQLYEFLGLLLLLLSNKTISTCRGWWPGWPGFNSQQGKRFFYTLQRLDWFCGLPSFLSILGSESRGTLDHILLSQIRDSPNLEVQVPVFISQRNRVAQL